MRLMAFHGGGEVVGPPGGGGPVSPYFFYVVEHPAGNVLFDSGGHPDLIDRPAHRLGAEVAAQYEVVMEPGDDVVSQLARAGLAPSDVGHVVQSHLHYDHAGGLEVFPHATAYVAREELRVCADPPPGQEGFYCPADWTHRTDWVLLDGEHDLFGDGRIVVVPTPGHTLGHVSLMVHLDGGTVILASDAAYRPEELAERRLSSCYADADAMLASYDRLAALRDEHDARLLFTHDLGWETATRVAPERWYD
jgi:N-acyl homoserine lactone hydrolase